MRLEALVFASADRVAVTTPAMATIVAERYSANPARVRVVPNFVDTELFTSPPAGEAAREDDLLVYVGRLHEEKNLLALIETLQDLLYRLKLAGDGLQRETLVRAAADLGVSTSFLGKVDNTDLPGCWAGLRPSCCPPRASTTPSPCTGGHELRCGLPGYGHHRHRRADRA